MPKKFFWFNLSLYFVLTAFTLSIAFAVGYVSGQHTERETSQTGLVAQVRDILAENYYGKLPEDSVLQRGAARGYIQAVGDPYTVFLDPPARALETQTLQGEFGGVGANLARNDQGDTVLTPQPDLPAEKAGVLAGDILIAVDGKPITKQMTLDEIVARVRGPIDSKVTLTIQRGSEQRDFTLTRQRIELPSVDWKVLEKNNTIGYIRLSRFTEKTPREMQRALDDLKLKKIERVVIDLRGNGGGLLTSVIDTTKLFLDGGVMMIEARKDEPEKIYSTADKGVAADMKVAVLINRGTASASEIFAGALRDRGRGPLIGQTSYGKGSVQLIFTLQDSSSIHVTHALWFTPQRAPINGVGLKPDMEIAPGVNGADPELDRGVEYLLSVK